MKDTKDIQAYSDAQTKVITAQSKKISELENKLVLAESKLVQLEKSSIVSSSLNKDQSQGSNSDGETICLIQLALLRSTAMNGELTLEETKKVEIYVKTLQIIRGKDTEGKKQQNGGGKLTTEELMKLVDEEMKQ